MKRFVGFCLVVVLIFSLAMPAFADDKKCDCNTLPVVLIHGFGSPLSYIDKDGQPTVNSNKAYPQFMICREHEELVPVTEKTDIHNDDMGFFAVLKRMWESFADLLGNFIKR